MDTVGQHDLAAHSVRWGALHGKSEQCGQSEVSTCCKLGPCKSGHDGLLRGIESIGPSATPEKPVAHWKRDIGRLLNMEKPVRLGPCSMECGYDETEHFAMLGSLVKNKNRWGNINIVVEIIES